jgi:hypothetical protein
MTEEEISIAKRLVQSPNWEWTPGMLVLTTNNIGAITPVRLMESIDNQQVASTDISSVQPSGRKILPLGYTQAYSWLNVDGLIPDLRDPATLGCIHHLIRKLWATKETKTRPIPVVNISECDGKWEVGYRYGEVRVSIFFSDLEIEAIAWALENGP